MSYDEVVKLILEKGEIQVSEKERQLSIQNMKNDIANIIVEKTFNTQNGLPFPQNIILKVLDDINFCFNEKEDAKKQALKAIKLIQEKDILPIERKLMQIYVTIKNSKVFQQKDYEEFKEKFSNFLKSSNSQVVDSNMDNPKLFKVKCIIHPNHYREILTNYEDGNKTN
jgi:ribosome maturation protein SDO1